MLGHLDIQVHIFLSLFGFLVKDRLHLLYLDLNRLSRLLVSECGSLVLVCLEIGEVVFIQKIKQILLLVNGLVDGCTNFDAFLLFTGVIFSKTVATTFRITRTLFPILELYFQEPLQELNPEVKTGQLDKGVANKVNFLRLQVRYFDGDFPVFFGARLEQLVGDFERLLVDDVFFEGRPAVSHYYAENSEFALDEPDLEISVTHLHVQIFRNRIPDQQFVHHLLGSFLSSLL